MERRKLFYQRKNIRLLCVNIEQNLSWNSHLLSDEKPLLPAMQKQLGALKYISKQIPQKSHRILANGLIVIKISFLIALWGGTYKTNIEQMQVILNKMARWITNSEWKVRTMELMSKC